MNYNQLTSREFEQLCNELADLDRQAVRRKEIEAQLREAIGDGRGEHRKFVKQHRALLRLQRKAAAEERERTVEALRAKIAPEARARLKASIAGLKEREEGNGRRSVGKFDDRQMIGD